MRFPHRARGTKILPHVVTRVSGEEAFFKTRDSDRAGTGGVDCPSLRVGVAAPARIGVRLETGNRLGEERARGNT